MEQLRICLLSYRSNPHCGGQGVYVQNLSRALKDLGHMVDVVSGPPAPYLDKDINFYKLSGLDLYNPDDLFRMPSLKELADPINLIEWLGVSSMGFPEPYTFGIRAYRFLIQKLSRYHIIHDNQSLAYGISALKRYFPVIATIHHPITVDRKLAVKTALSFWQKIKQLRWYSFIHMQKKVARTLSQIITVSERAKEDISKDFKIPQNRFRIVPNGIDTDFFRPIPEIQRENNRIIVTNSADTALKGLIYLLQAVAEISKIRKVRLIVVGALPENSHTEQIIRRLGIKDSITFTGRIHNDEFVKQYARASVAVVPSLYEGFGLPAGEAMACGLPVVSTTGGALPEVVGKAGLIVPPADSSALADAITTLLDNPEMANKLGHEGYKRVHTLFTWKRAAQLTVNTYREAIRDYNRFQPALH